MRFFVGIGYRKALANDSVTDFDDPASPDQEEDEQTLAAIDKGICDAEAGRIVTMDEVRRLLPHWGRKPKRF